MIEYIVYKLPIYNRLKQLMIFPTDLENIINDYLPEVDCNIKSITITDGSPSVNGEYLMISPFTYSNENGSIWLVTNKTKNNILGGMNGWIPFCGCLAMDSSYWIETNKLVPPKSGWKSYFHTNDMNGAGPIKECLLRGSRESQLRLRYNF